MSDSYLNWMVKNTKTRWWHDSGDADELTAALALGATGVTTNPLLAAAALRSCGSLWRAEIDGIFDRRCKPDDRSEALMALVVGKTAERLRAVHERTDGRDGYVCAQVSPLKVGERAAMLAQARRFAAIAPNIAVKLPACAAGLDVLEDGLAEGITITATLSFTVAQVMAVADGHRRGVARARERGVAPGRCFAVIMIGRLDDYLAELAADGRTALEAGDLQQAGLAVTKRAYDLLRQRGGGPELIVAACRGTYHLSELLGGDLIMSVHPKIQAMLAAGEMPREERVARPVPAAVIERLRRLPDFVRAFEPDGLARSDFLGWGLTQRTVAQFVETGWKQIESFVPGWRGK